MLVLDVYSAISLVASSALDSKLKAFFAPSCIFLAIDMIGWAIPPAHEIPLGGSDHSALIPPKKHDHQAQMMERMALSLGLLLLGWLV